MIRVLKWIQAMIYMALFCVPGIAMVAGLSSFNVAKFERQELRAPAPFPTPAVLAESGNSLSESFEAFPSLFEAWFNDHYGFRRAFITGNSKLNVAFDIFPGGNIDAEVLKGQNGRLFLGDHRQNVMSQHSGDGFVVSDEYLRNIVHRFRNWATWLKGEGVPFRVLIAPDKHTIYPEDLPSWLIPYDGPTVVDRFVEAAAKQGIHVVDPRGRLEREKAENPGLLYYNTDTHWSDLGAFFAYEETMRSLAGRFPGLKSLTMKGYKTAANAKGYDLARLSNQVQVDDFSLKIEFFEQWHPLAGKSFDGEAVAVPMEMHIPTGMDVIVSNASALNPQRMIILRDSCSLSLSPMFNQTFAEVIYTSREKHGGLKDLVKTYNPDVVVFQIVERFLPYM